MRILTVYYTNKGGGYFKSLRRMIDVALEKNWEVHYISTAKFPIEHPKLNFHKLPRIFGQEYLFFSYFLLVLPFYVSYITLRYKIDVFAVIGTQYAFTCSIAKLIFGRSLITFIPGDLIQELHLKNRPKPIIYLNYLIGKIGLMCSDKIYAMNHDLKKRIINEYNLKNEVGVLYNSINPTEFYPRESKSKVFKEFNLKNNSFLIGYVGVLNPIKQVDVLINAFFRLSGLSYMSCVLLIIGNGPEELKLRKLATKLDIADRVVFAGWRDDIPEIMSSLDLLVLPSRYEGCPNTLLEALGCETPCIGSDVGGISEILKYEELLFKSSDIKDLSLKLTKIVENDEYYKKIGNLCNRRKQEFIFDWDGEIIKILSPGSTLQ